MDTPPFHQRNKCTFTLYDKRNKALVTLQGFIRDDGSAAILWATSHRLFRNAVRVSCTDKKGETQEFNIAGVKKDPRKSWWPIFKRPCIMLLSRNG